MSHMSMLGVVGTSLLWEESLFWAQAYFCEEDLFWEQTHFLRERPIFGARATGGRKEACRKIRKNNVVRMQK
jgi:hypothetical protein